MSSTNVAKGVARVDKRLVGDELAEPDEIKLNGVTQGQLNIMRHLQEGYTGPG